MRPKAIVIIISISFILITATHFGLTKPVTSLVSPVFLPLQIGFNRFVRRLVLEVGTVTQIGSIRDKNRALEYTNALLSAENVQLKQQGEENKLLRDQLNSPVKASLVTPALTIGFSQIGSTKFLQIDKGDREGVVKNQLVIVRNVLIGKIQAVGAHSANVLLLTHPDFKLPAVTQKNAKGLSVGHYQNEVLLSKVLPEDKLDVGDDVMTSGEAGYPKGLLIGKIEKVQKSDQDIFQEAHVRPLLDPENLDLVFILH